jgi:hypothetical protein
MTAPSLIDPPSTNETLKASVVEYTNARVALATAILGSGGASLVWLIYMAVKADDAGLILTVAVGATIGFAVHWLQHYVRVAIRERNGETTGHRTARRPLIALLWAASVALVALSAEHLVIEMVGHYFGLLLASLASLVPAGAIIGWTMNRGRSKDENLFSFLATGLTIGLVIALVTGIIWTIAFGNAPWGALVGWWGLIGLGTHLVTRRERNAVGMADPLAAIVIVFVGTFLVNLLPTSGYEKLGAFGGIPVAIRWMAAEVPAAPGIPGPFSIDQERDVLAKRASAERFHFDSVARARAAGQSSRGSTGLGSGVDSLLAPPGPPPSAMSRSLAIWRSDQRSEYVFSWLIVLCFALGAGLAPSVERTLRPIDYPNSETFGRDVVMSLVMLALVVAACVLGRWFK